MSQYLNMWFYWPEPCCNCLERKSSLASFGTKCLASNRPPGNNIDHHCDYDGDHDHLLHHVFGFKLSPWKQYWPPWALWWLWWWSWSCWWRPWSCWWWAWPCWWWAWPCWWWAWPSYRGSLDIGGVALGLKPGPTNRLLRSPVLRLVLVAFLKNLR